MNSLHLGDVVSHSRAILKADLEYAGDEDGNPDRRFVHEPVLEEVLVNPVAPCLEVGARAIGFKAERGDGAGHGGRGEGHDEGPLIFAATLLLRFAATRLLGCAAALVQLREGGGGMGVGVQMRSDGRRPDEKLRGDGRRPDEKLQGDGRRPDEKLRGDGRRPDEKLQGDGRRPDEKKK
ncbi:unnamed protein product [Closterium sp. NIES-64]|nr:unnamed protein product [Closterium sp. NIES-64]